MKIAIAGSGAMGCVYGHMLKQGGNEVVLLDGWAEHVQTINAQGLQVGEVGVVKVTDIPAYAPADYNEQVDLVVLFTKSLALEAMLEQIRHIIGEHTQVLCLLNGLGHAYTVAKYVQPSNILMGVTVLTAALLGPGRVEFTSYGKTEIQNMADEPEAQARAQAVVQMFNDCGLPTEYATDIKYAIWRKACVNGAMNSLCTILDANMAMIGYYTQAYDLLYAVIHEFSLVAKAFDGVEFDAHEFTEMVLKFTSPSFSGSVHYPSMHQDLIKNHRLTEVDFLNGYVARRGKELGIPTPYNELITHLVHAKEYVLGVRK